MAFALFISLSLPFTSFAHSAKLNFPHFCHLLYDVVGYRLLYFFLIFLFYLTFSSFSTLSNPSPILFLLFSKYRYFHTTTQCFTALMCHIIFIVFSFFLSLCFSFSFFSLYLFSFPISWHISVTFALPLDPFVPFLVLSIESQEYPSKIDSNLVILH